MIMAIPKKYIEEATHELLGKKIPAIRAKTGSFALQGISRVNIIISTTIFFGFNGTTCHDSKNTTT